MAGCEQQAKQVVADVIVNRGVKAFHGHFLLRLELATNLLMLAFQPFVSSEKVDGAMLRRGHKPGAWIVRYPRLRPLLQRGDESVLGELLSAADVAHDSRERRDELCGLDFPNRLDGAMCIVVGHDYTSHHLQSGGARRCV